MTTCSRRPRLARLAGGRTVLAFLSLPWLPPALLQGQQAALRPGQRPGPRFVVATLRSDTSSLGFEMAEALRARLASDFDIRALMVVPESSITKALADAGLGPRQALTASDNRQLAQQFQADEYLDGSIVRTPDGGYHVQVDWGLARRDDMVQPLPAIDGRKLSEVAKAVSHEVQQARKQVEAVRTCMEASRAREYPRALSAARQAIANYPRSSLARVCIANVYVEQHVAPDSMIQIAEEILAIDPTNRRALTFASDAYRAKGDSATALTKLVALADLDPTDVATTVRVGRALGEAGQFDRALELVSRTARLNPANAELLGLQWRLALAGHQWSLATTVGRELLVVDTTAADADFYRRTAAAFVEDSQPAQAAEFLAGGVARFPDADDLSVLRVQLLRRTGQLQAAMDAVDQLLARRPSAPNAWVQRARIQVELKASDDSVMTSLTQAVAHGEEKVTVAGYAATLGQGASRAAQASKGLDDLRLATRYFRLAESILPRDTTAFLLGAAHLSLGQQLYVRAREVKDCSMAHEMQASLTEAQVNIAKGGRAFPDLAAQLLGRLSEVLPFASQLERAVCR
ncbi:MAG: hypothetical protein U0132_14420 [Gemmatimonadaceae bacterium]